MIRISALYMVNILLSIFWLRKPGVVSYPQNEEDLPFICLNLPILCEPRKAVEEAITYFTNLNYPRNKLSINIITSEKERLYSSLEAIGFIDALIEKRNHEINAPVLSRFHYPYPEGNKASQLNYAISSLGLFEAEDQVFIGTYDIDSRPHRDTLLILGQDYLQALKKPLVFQQFSLYLKNFEDLNLALKASAVYQSLWSLCYEIPVARKQYKLLSKAKKFLHFFNFNLIYCIGHGHFVRWDVLKSIGLYPTYTNTEDLQLGYLLSFQQIPIKPLPVLDNSSMPNTIKAFLMQNARWFGGELDLPHTVRILERTRKLHFRPFIFAYIKRLIGISKWLMGPLVVLAALVESVFLRNIHILAGLLISISIYSILRYLMFFIYVGVTQNNQTNGITQYKLSDQFWVTIISPLRCLTNILGPIIYLWRTLISDKKLDFIPTSLIDRKGPLH